MIVLLVIGSVTCSYYAGVACTNYGETKRQRVLRVFQWTLMGMGAIAALVGVAHYPFVF